MALKKRRISRSEEVQLYTLEMILKRLSLLPEGRNEDAACRATVRVNLADLASVDIVADGLIEVNDTRKNKGSALSDGTIGSREPGKSCLLARTPADLIRSIKSIPLSIEVYRIPRGEDCNCRDNGRTPLRWATAFLPSCFRERAAATREIMDGLPAPYTLKNIYPLIDDRGSSRGSVSVLFRLSRLATFHVHDFTPRRESSLDVSPFRRESLPCAASPAGEERATNGEIDDSVDNTSRRILQAEEDRRALTRPESPPRVSMGQPGFHELTNAEKLNDGKFRDFVYRAYPNEPICSCSPTDGPTHPPIRPSASVRSCCATLRNAEALEKHSDDIACFGAAAERCDEEEEEEEEARYVARMRGGGDEEDVGSQNGLVCEDGTYIWFTDDLDLQSRLTGGGEYGRSPFDKTTNVIYENCRPNTSTSSCRPPPRPRTADQTRADCACPGRDTSWRTGERSKCTKRQCLGADCMIRAFKEAQDFVDSFGKVPGLAGLGLMDPSESPYFGRNMDRDYVLRESASEKKREHVAQPAYPYPPCIAPCNTQIPKVAVSNHASALYATQADSTALPARNGIVREAIPTLPEMPIVSRFRRKEDRKDEKWEKQKEPDVTAPAAPLDADVGPCGEPKCKARRKTAAVKQSGSREIAEEEAASKRSAVRSKASNATVARAGGKPGEKRRGRKMKPGPGGDIDRGGAPVKVSKRIMRYIYTIGDVYPGINYGHKNCIDPRLRVPANMGWLWNTTGIAGKHKPRIGWKPGAIGRYLNELLKEAKAGTLLEDDDRPRSVPSRTRRGKAHRTVSYASAKKSQAKREGEEDAEPPPTLHIHRKDGTYYVTMYPIKQETATDVPQLDEPIKPLQFKIVRNRDGASDASSSTASDMEIEFSPPAAVNRYRRKPDVIHVDTQVRQQEILDAFKSTDASDKGDKKGKKEKKKKKK